MPGMWADHVSQTAGMRQHQRYGAPQMQMDLNIPGLEGNPMLGVLGQMALSQFSSHFGGIPSQFLPQQNLYDQMRAKHYWMEHNAAIQAGRAQDTETEIMAARGVAGMFGIQWTPDTDRFARSALGSSFGQMALDQFAMMAPTTFDQLHGSRGSSRVMAHFIHQGGLSRVDPVTGRRGLSGATSGAMADEIFGGFFGDRSNISSWRGLSAGTAGQAFEELQSRGLMGRSLGIADPMTQKLLVGHDMGLIGPGGPPGGIDALMNMAPADFENKLQRLDAKQATRRIKDMSAAITAMRDIFGDMGRPNAPMSELIEGLNQLTQGGLTSMSPARLEQMVRQFHAASQHSGLGMDQMMAMSASSAAMADQLGLDRTFVPGMVTGSAAFHSAIQAVGITPGWGVKDIDTLRQRDLQLRGGAAKSTMANQMNAILRTTELLDVDGASDMGRLSAAIKSGQTTWTDAAGRKRSVDLNREEYMQMMQADAGLSRQQAADTLSQDYANQEYGQKFGTGDLVRRMQGARSVQQRLSRSMESDLRSALEAGGMAKPAAQKMAQAGAGDLAEFMRHLPQEIRNDTGKLHDALTAKIHTMANGALTWEQAQSAAMTSIGNAEKVAAQQNTTLKGMLQEHDPEVIARAQVEEQDIKARARLQSLMGGFGKDSVLARGADLLIDPPATAMEGLKRMLNVQDPEKLREKLMQGGGRTASLSGSERYAVQVDEFLKMTRQFQGIVDDKNLTADQKRTRQDDLAKSMEAMKLGGTAAKEEISRLLKGKGLTDADLDAVLKGDLLKDDDPGLRDRISALKLASVETMDELASSQEVKEEQEKVTAAAADTKRAEEETTKHNRQQMAQGRKKVIEEARKEDSSWANWGLDLVVGAGEALGIVGEGSMADEHRKQRALTKKIAAAELPAESSDNPDEATARPNTVRLSPDTTLRIIMDGKEYPAVVANAPGSVPV